MRGGYEKVRPVSQKAGIRRPVPEFVEWPLAGSHPFLFVGSARISQNLHPHGLPPELHFRES
jgi:hypothetical protein